MSTASAGTRSPSKNNDIATHDFAAGDAIALAIANDQRARAGKIT
jgi:hypothetical protein